MENPLLPAFLKSLTKSQRKAYESNQNAIALSYMIPLFIPLYTRYFEAFKAGKKKTEFRTYGKGWNENTCRVGRLVTLSKGYGKYERLTGIIEKFSVHKNTACIRIRVIPPGSPVWRNGCLEAA